MTRLLAYSAEALAAIWRNRTRSILTMLGMIIGTSSVIAVLGVGSAASGGIAASLDSFGDPGIFMEVDSRQNNPAAAQIQYRDVATIAQEAAGAVAHIFPQYQRTYRMKAAGVVYDGSVVGQTDYVVDTLTLREGHRIGAYEVNGAEHVALISQPLERRFFGTELGLGQIVHINGVQFRIIGVYDELKAGIFSNIGGSDYIEIPYTTFHELAPGPIDGLTIYPRPGVGTEQAEDAVRAVLQHIHGSDAKYIGQDASAFEGAFEKVVNVVSLGITAIGGVALLVAGIGVMNIMLVSVTERTREIGIRKAIGGSANDIVLQFLMEAVILSLIGGGVGMLVGIGIAVAASAFVAQLVGPAPIPYVEIVLVAVGFSALVGVVFGTYPAMRAGKLDPIEALRS